MTTPKLQFKIADLDTTLKLANQILNQPQTKAQLPQEGHPRETNHSPQTILTEYPILEKRLSNIQSTEEKTKITNKFFRHIQKDIKGKTIKSMNTFQKTWNSIEENAMNAISQVIETPWPKHLQNFTTNLTFLPVNNQQSTVNGQQFTKDLYYKSNVQEMKDTIIHELIRFLYFEKWKQIFKKTPQEHFESPHLEWEMSKIVIKAILNDNKIQKITRLKPQTYPEYENIIINDNLLLNHIDKFYKEKTSFEDFLKTTWKFIQKNQQKIKEQLN